MSHGYRAHQKSEAEVHSSYSLGVAVYFCGKSVANQLLIGHLNNQFLKQQFVRLQIVYHHLTTVLDRSSQMQQNMAL